MIITEKDLINSENKVKFNLSKKELEYIENRLNKIFKNSEKLFLIENQYIDLEILNEYKKYLDTVY